MIHYVDGLAEAIFVKMMALYNVAVIGASWVLWDRNEDWSVNIRKAEKGKPSEVGPRRSVHASKSRLTSTTETIGK